MGKKGKERKRKRLQEGALGTDPDFDDGGDEEIDSSEDAGNSDRGKEGEGERELDVKVFMKILNLLTRNQYLYQTKRLKAFRKAIFPLLSAQRHKFFEPDPIEAAYMDQEEIDRILSPQNLTISMRCATYFSLNKESFNSSSNKIIRKALHPIVNLHFVPDTNHACSFSSSQKGKDEQISNSIHQAFRLKKWAEALKGLRKLALSSEIPKLGALQRWVRECNVTYEETNCVGDNYSSIYLSLLDAVMRCMIKRQVSSSNTSSINHASSVHNGYGGGEWANEMGESKIMKCPIFAVSSSSSPSLQQQLSSTSNIHHFDANLFMSTISLLHCVPGKERRPVSIHDLNIYASSTDSFPFGINSNSNSNMLPVRVDVPGVPGAFVLRNILSESECDYLISAAETMKYTPDVVEGIDNLTMIADHHLLNVVYNRCRELMPQAIGECSLVGINARFRFFRYFESAVYRPHIDGSWPGSGIDCNGKLVDNFYNDRVSKLTFLVYLNSGFTGGATTFFVPNSDEVGTIEARGVEPTQGCILCFPHGDSEYSLIHEGSAVVSGTKYVIRTDVLYRNRSDRVAIDACSQGSGEGRTKNELRNDGNLRSMMSKPEVNDNNVRHR